MGVDEIRGFIKLIYVSMESARSKGKRKERIYSLLLIKFKENIRYVNLLEDFMNTIFYRGERILSLHFLELLLRVCE